MVLRRMARWVAPPSCVVCRREGQVVCQTCIATLTAPRLRTCFWCGASSLNGRTCSTCRTLIALEGLVVASHYEGASRQLVGLLKYHHQRDAATALAATPTPLLDAACFDLVKSVPVATSRLRQRGYNQSELITWTVARSLALPYRPLLRRLRNTQQVGGLFVARSHPPARVLIVDDVLTTGATLNACAIALQAAGASEVWGAVAARD